jgi:leader peptidase (prepilin peptidase)/N-methyltransferase
LTLATPLFVVFVVTTLAVLSWYDARDRIIPNRIVLPAWAIVLASQMALRPDRWAEWLIASGLAFAVFLLPALAVPAALGMGDVKLAGLLGAALGYTVLSGLLIGTLLAGAYCAFLLIRHGAAARRIPIPYGPFLAAGAVAGLMI